MNQPHCPPPGIYNDVPFSEYLSWDAISNSSLQAALKSMRHYKHQQPIDESPAMKLGTLCHAGKFEPLLIAQRYVVMPAFEKDIRKSDGSFYDKPKSTAAYRELVEEFQQTNATKIIVTQDEYDAMLGVVSALAAHERACQYLSVDGSTAVEVAIVWVDPETGLTCKGRVDCLQTSTCIASDLKTSRYVQSFDRVIYNRSYHRQGAFYCDGLEVLTGEEHSFTITAVEEARPFGVRAAPLSADAIEAGRDEYKRLLQQIAESRKTNQWPGYSDPDEWRLPAYAAKTDDDVALVIGGETVRM